MGNNEAILPQENNSFGLRKIASCLAATFAGRSELCLLTYKILYYRFGRVQAKYGRYPAIGAEK